MVTVVTVVVLWILYGLLNLFIMKRADKIAKDNPPCGVYWLKNWGTLKLVLAVLVGFCSLPFTIWAACDWYRLSKQA